jgi:hypothetical protein
VLHTTVAHNTQQGAHNGVINTQTSPSERRTAVGVPTTQHGPCTGTPQHSTATPYHTVITGVRLLGKNVAKEYVWRGWGGVGVVWGRGWGGGDVGGRSQAVGTHLAWKPQPPTAHSGASV